MFGSSWVRKYMRLDRAELSTRRRREVIDGDFTWGRSRGGLGTRVRVRVGLLGSHCVDNKLLRCEINCFCSIQILLTLET